MQEGRLLQADVDEGGLHPGQDPDHPALVDVAHDPPAAGALDVDLLQEPVLHDGHPHLLRGDVDQDLSSGHSARIPCSLSSWSVSNRGRPITPE